LRGKVVLVTGAARGIGAATARLAAAAGARLALVGLEPDRLAALAAELGPGHVHAGCDVTDQSTVERAVASTVDAFGRIRLEVAHLGVGVGTAHPVWIDTDLVRDAQEDLPSFRRTLARLPRPVGSVIPVGRCAQSLVDGMVRRRRRVYVPRSIVAVAALRTVVLGPVGQAVLRRGARDSVPVMEAEVRALGRNFGEHSAG
jgi:NAD(P)-dependent dehydrogenase (short-subunit alcohol dehydrogenase family)